MRAALLVVALLFASVIARYSDDVDEDIESSVNFREAIVIGSGFGGSVAAFHLANAGVKTLVLERGQSWDTGDGTNEFGPFPTTDNLDERVAWCLPLPPLAPLWNPKPIFAGITTGIQSGWSPQRNPYEPGQCILTNGIVAVAGSGVGGGSLIYNGVAFYPERKVWEYSRSINANSSLYEGLYDELNENYFGRALHRTGASRVPNEIFTNPQWSGARLNQRLSAEAGFGCGHPDIGTNTVPQAVNWEKVKEELEGKRAPSVIKGEAWFGNNSGAKRSVDQPDNYLGKAIATGNVELKTYRDVIDISARRTFSWSGRSYIYTVTARVLNAYCQVVGTETYYTRKLFVAAGSVPSTALLLRAKAKGNLPNLNSYVGTGFTGNGNMGANRFILNGTTVQSAGPASVATHRFNWDPETEVPIAIEVLPQIVGPSATNAAQINNINLFTVGVGIPEAGEVGHFTYDSTTDCVTLNWPTGANYQESKIFKTFVKAVDEMTPDWISFIPPLLSQNPLPSTVHPLGGVPLGRATDQYCRAQGYQGLYVVDGSVVPFAPGGNPYLTIVALIERCMDNIIDNDFQPFFPWKH